MLWRPSASRTYSTKSVELARRVSPVLWSSILRPDEPGTKWTRSPPRSAWGAPSRSYRTKEPGASAMARSTTSRGKRIRPASVCGRPASSSRRRISGPRISKPTSARTRFASSTIRPINSSSRMFRLGRMRLLGSRHQGGERQRSRLEGLLAASMVGYAVSRAPSIPPDGPPVARDATGVESASVERHCLAPVGDVRVEAERTHFRFDGDLGLSVAVDEEDASREAGTPLLFALGEVAEPVQQLGLVGMGREAADRADPAAYVAVLAVELDDLHPGLDVRPERSLTLVPDEQQRRVRIPDEIPQVPDDPPACQHPVRRDDHVRPRCGRDGLGLRQEAGLVLVRVIERRVALAQQLARLLVEVGGVAAVDVGRLRGHRRIEVERKQRDFAAVDQSVELPDDLLRPTDRKRRDEQHALRLRDHSDRLGEDPDRLVAGFVLPSPIGRLDEDVIGVGQDGRVADDRGAGPTEVAGEDDRPLRATLALDDADADDRGTQDMAGIEVAGMDPGGDLELRVVLDRPELGDGCLGFLLRLERLIEIDLELRGLVAELDLRVRYRRRGCRRDGRGHLLRHARGGDRGSIGCRRWSLRLFGRTPASAELDGRLGMLGEMNGSVVGRAFLCVVVSHLVRMLALPACLPLGELLLEAARVEEDQLGQLACPAGGDDRAVEAGVDDMRDQPAVVEMSVRQENRVDP